MLSTSVAVWIFGLRPSVDEKKCIFSFLFFVAKSHIKTIPLNYIGLILL